MFGLDDVQPICLPIERRLRFLDVTAVYPYVAGWGSTSYCNAPSFLNRIRRAFFFIV